jgi:hypothetical protein
MEMALSYGEIVEGHNKFLDFISDPFNKQLILSTIENCVFISK